MSDVMRVDVPLSEIGVRPESGEFENRCLAVASEKISEEISSWANGAKVIDIEINDTCVTVMLGEKVVQQEFSGPKLMEDDEDSCPGDCGHDCDCDHSASEDDISEDDIKVISIEDSVAWEGPLGNATFEIDVIDMCALLDVMGFAQHLSQATGAISPTIGRSMHKLEMMLAEKIGEVGEDGKTHPSADFYEHASRWQDESTTIFNEIAESQKRRVVRAEIMPGPNFDPTGGQGGPQGGPPLHLR